MHSGARCGIPCRRCTRSHLIRIDNEVLGAYRLAFIKRIGLSRTRDSTLVNKWSNAIMQHATPLHKCIDGLTLWIVSAFTVVVLLAITMLLHHKACKN